MTFRATYRLQFHGEFTFAHAIEVVPYLADLGVSHVYASPILAARAGSRHGYDVVDHSRINPELGGETGFRSLAAALRGRELGILLDIVPNHMAVGGADNSYWLDLLEKGRNSVFANFFDIDWDAGSPESIEDKVVVPMLGKPLATSVSSGEITLVWDARRGKFAFAYGDNRFPLRREDADVVKGTAADPANADLSPFADPRELARLLARQHYRLAYWRDAGERINWRRFFDITSLAALRVEDDAVFEQTHGTIIRLFAEGLIDGVRVDHVDGLADPAAYCRRLRARLEAHLPDRPESLPRERAIVIVEKILARGERLPVEWDVDGTTGYDFLDAVSAFQHDPAAEPRLTALWTSISGRPGEFESEERLARTELLSSAFRSALHTTASAFAALLEDDDDIDCPSLENAVAALLQQFRAYRTYAVGDAHEPQPGPWFDAALESARAAAAGSGAMMLRSLEFVASVLRGEHAQRGPDARDAVRRFNQLAAPLAAKAVEDTAFYRYGRWLSRNDVGTSPAHFSLSADELHAENAHRASLHPRALLATATHDHKRGEDSRARLAALSELAAEWERTQACWFALNAPFRPAEVLPADEYQLYQSLVAAWPQGLSPADTNAVSAFVKRVTVWRGKSLREAKLQTSWSEPNETVEGAHREYVERLFAPAHSFAACLAAFVDWLAPAAALNSLVTTVLRCTCPGIPDLYQGTELWDLSMVDPDNRRAVDFAERTKLLSHAADVEPLANWQSGEPKLRAIRLLLTLRKEHPALFAGRYVPIGSTSHRVFAFARMSDAGVLVVAVPRLCASDAIAHGRPLPRKNSALGLRLRFDSDLRDRTWLDAFHAGRARRFQPESLFDGFPAAVLYSI